VFRIFHIYNTGATFGLFAGGGDIFRYLAIVVSLGIIYYNHILPGDQRLLRLALGLQMGGALGNMIDRFRIGHVTDFIDIGPWYIFNLADLAVVSGAIILGIIVWRESRELKAQQEENNHQEMPRETAVPPQTDPSHE
jgi:signal peptidase II